MQLYGEILHVKPKVSKVMIRFMTAYICRFSKLTAKSKHKYPQRRNKHRPFLLYVNHDIE